MGELESIQTGGAWQFQGLEPLLGFLAAQLRRQPAHLSRHAGTACLIEYNSSELRPDEPDELPLLRQSIIQNGAGALCVACWQRAKRYAFWCGTRRPPSR